MDKELQNLLPADKFEIWTLFCDLVESLYEMERKLDTTKWNNWRYVCKYRRGGKTLCTLFANDVSLCVQIVFGKKEREKFELEQDHYSHKIQTIYNESNTFHDGKWMDIYLEDLSLFDDLKKMLFIKRKPNKK